MLVGTEERSRGSMTRNTEPISASPVERVRRPVMYQSWTRITFVHWSYPPDAIQRLLPEPLIVDRFDGRAWIGVTPFLLTGLTAPGLPPLPWISTSPETNVRTYVRAPDGRRGIWFFSLDFARLPAVAVARAAYRLPYMWSELRVDVSPRRVAYRGRRRWGGPRASYDIEIRPIAPLSSVGALDEFLTARWRLFTTYGRQPAFASAEHPPWPLWSAEAVRVEQGLLAAAGIPAPTSEPLLHFSPGVRARIGPPRLLRDERAAP
jgi:uncharacterized protein